METLATSILEVPESAISPIPLSEPDPNDLSDLDLLLQESVKIQQLSKPATMRRVYKELKQSTESMIAEHTNQVCWVVLDTISVWQRTYCKCGHRGVVTLTRYMQKLKKVGSTTIHWETIEKPEPGVEVRKTLVVRETDACGICCPGDKFEDFKETIK